MDGFGRDKSLSMFVAGAGLALGITGLYKYYKSNHEMSCQMRTLVDSIDQLKKEVEELRIASQRGSPAMLSHASFFPNNSTTDGGHPFASISGVENGIVEEDNDEFFDFTEGVGEEALAQIDAALDDLSSDKNALYSSLLDLHHQMPEDGELLIRMAKVCRLLALAAEKVSDAEGKKKYSYEAVKWAKEAIEKCSNSCEANKWFAISLGSLSDLVPTKEKIENGVLFKKHLDIAMSIDSSDSTLHHMLGRYCLEIASLKWWERKIASTLFSEVPEATYEEALGHLLRAHDIKPEWKENILYICKSYVALKQNEDACKWIQKGLNIPSLGTDDQVVHDQLSVLATKFIE